MHWKHSLGIWKYQNQSCVSKGGWIVAASHFIDKLKQKKNNLITKPGKQRKPNIEMEVEGAPPAAPQPAMKVSHNHILPHLFRENNTFLYSQKRESAKQLWLLTYGAGCRSADQVIFTSCGLEVEECYTATWRESKYTLIKLSNVHRIRTIAVVKVMQRMKDNYGIIGTEIFGFDVISCNSQMNDENLFAHPGFKMMVDIMNKDISKLEWWMRDGDITSNRKGLLWKHIQSTDPTQMTRAQLVQQVKEWGPAMKDYAELKQTYTILLAKQIETENAYQLAQSCYENEQKLNEEITKMLTTKMDENFELKKEMITLRPRRTT